MSVPHLGSRNYRSGGSGDGGQRRRRRRQQRRRPWVVDRRDGVRSALLLACMHVLSAEKKPRQPGETL